MQGKLFQRCAHLLYCSVLSLGGNVNTRRMSKPDMGSIFQIKNQWNILVIGNFYVNYQNCQNLILLTSSNTKRTLMYLFLFTNSAHRENWFQYVRRAYATAFNFHCILTLVWSILIIEILTSTSNVTTFKFKINAYPAFNVILHC